MPAFLSRLLSCARARRKTTRRGGEEEDEEDEEDEIEPATPVGNLRSSVSQPPRPKLTKLGSSGMVYSNLGRMSAGTHAKIQQEQRKVHWWAKVRPHPALALALLTATVAVRAHGQYGDVALPHPMLSRTSLSSTGMCAALTPMPVLFTCAAATQVSSRSSARASVRGSRTSRGDNSLVMTPRTASFVAQGGELPPMSDSLAILSESSSSVKSVKAIQENFREHRVIHSARFGRTSAGALALAC